MSDRKTRVVLRLLLWFLALVSLCGACKTGGGISGEIQLQKTLRVWEAPDLQRITIRRVAILPFSAPHAGAEVQGSDLVCSFCGQPIREHKDFSKTGERIGSYLYQEVIKAVRYEILPLEEVYSRLNIQEEHRDVFTDIGFVMDFGKNLGVDVVVVGEVTRVRERVGGPFSVVEPASVAFRLKMIRVHDGSELYKAVFDETQKPLSEEPEKLFKWSKIRFRWHTADQLAQAGVREVAKSFPGVGSPKH